MENMIKRSHIVDFFKKTNNSTLTTFVDIGYPKINTDMQYLTFSNNKLTIVINEEEYYMYNNKTLQILLLSPEDERVAKLIQEKIRLLEVFNELSKVVPPMSTTMYEPPSEGCTMCIQYSPPKVGKPTATCPHCKRVYNVEIIGWDTSTTPLYSDLQKKTRY